MANVNPNNQITAKGRLGQTPELRWTNDHKAVLNLSMAISNDWFNQETQEWVPAEPTWVNVILWGNLAERYAEQLQKGAMVRVVGKLGTRKRTLSKEVTVGSGKGAKAATVEYEVTETFVTAASVEVIPSRTEASNSAVARQSNAVMEPDF